MKNIPSKYAAFLAIIFGISLPSFALAQNIFFKGTTFCTYMNSVFDFSVAIVGSLTVVAIIAGGIAYATSGGNPERVKSAKDIIVSSIVGMILVLGSYLLFNVIAPNVLQCKEPGTAATSTKGATSVGTSGTAASSGAAFSPSDKSLTDMCQGKQVSATKEACNGGSGTGSCLKGKTGWCKTTCGDSSQVVSAFKKMKGMCIITNHCAFITNQALQASGCPDFSGISSTAATAKQLLAWNFKEHKYDPNNATKSLAAIKPGAVLIFKGHTAVYTGGGKFIDATVGYYSQCGKDLSSLPSKHYKNLVGKNLECAKKIPTQWQDRNPTVAGNDKKKTRSGYTYQKPNRGIQCVAEHSLKNGKVYRSSPLLSYYQPE